jgi:hypothetical protein
MVAIVVAIGGKAAENREKTDMIASRSVPDPCVSVSAIILFPSFFLLFSRRHFSPRHHDLAVRTAG